MKKIEASVRFGAVAFFVVLAVVCVWAAAESSEKGASEAEKKHHFVLELKREATNRGTPDETTKSQVKMDALLDGFVNLLRLEVPLPDEKTSFEGDPFNPRLGDIKVRTGFRPAPLNGISLGSFLEVTFPTADPQDLGSGKYQVSLGIRTNIPVPLGKWLPESHKLSFEPLIKQVVSVAGDEDRKNINYTRFELALRDTWRKKYWLKLTAKPTIDWVQDAETGAVGELEGGRHFGSRRRVWLLLGTRLWGEKVPGNYDQRVGVNAAVGF